MEMQQELTLTNCQTSTSLLEDSLAKLLALLEKEVDLTTQEAHFSLTSLGFLKKNNQECLLSSPRQSVHASIRRSKGSFRTGNRPSMGRGEHETGSIRAACQGSWGERERVRNRESALPILCTLSPSDCSKIVSRATMVIWTGIRRMWLRWRSFDLLEMWDFENFSRNSWYR